MKTTRYTRRGGEVDVIRIRLPQDNLSDSDFRFYKNLIPGDWWIKYLPSCGSMTATLKLFLPEHADGHRRNIQLKDGDFMVRELGSGDITRWPSPLFYAVHDKDVSAQEGNLDGDPFNV